MALLLNTNIDAMVTQTALTVSGLKKALAIQRLGTGFRINTVKDDAAGVRFDERFQRRSFALGSQPSYQAYRLNITQVADPSCANAVQLADMELLGQQVSA